MSSSIYNFAHPQRKGFIRLAHGGKELFGTVIKQGKMDKTVTVSGRLADWLGACVKLPLRAQGLDLAGQGPQLPRA